MSTPPNPEHVRQLTSGVKQWNAWRERNPAELPRLRGVDMSRACLDKINLRGADLYTATFWRANLNRADLRDADLSSATLNGVSLRGADLRGANLRFARLVGADVADARFSGCHMYGCSIWNLHGLPADQLDVVVTPRRQSPVTVDDLLLAQFIYLLMNSGGLRDTLQIVASKAVLLLGRFTPERKAVLDALREDLRTRGFIPIMFDFDPLPNQPLMQTVSTLAHMARFVVADITQPRSVQHELATIVPALQLVPVQPILLESEQPWPMFESLQVYHSVLPVFRYKDLDHLRSSLDQHVIGPAVERSQEQLARLHAIRAGT